MEKLNSLKSPVLMTHTPKKLSTRQTSHFYTKCTFCGMVGSRGSEIYKRERGLLPMASNEEGRRWTGDEGEAPSRLQPSMGSPPLSSRVGPRGFNNTCPSDDSLRGPFLTATRRQEWAQPCTRGNPHLPFLSSSPLI